MHPNLTREFLLGAHSLPLTNRVVFRWGRLRLLSHLCYLVRGSTCCLTTGSSLDMSHFSFPTQSASVSVISVCGALWRLVVTRNWEAPCLWLPQLCPCHHTVNSSKSFPLLFFPSLSERAQPWWVKKPWARWPLSSWVQFRTTLKANTNYVQRFLWITVKTCEQILNINFL